MFIYIYINPFALKTAKTPKSFGRSECKGVKRFLIVTLLNDGILYIHVIT